MIQLDLDASVTFAEGSLNDEAFQGLLCVALPYVSLDIASYCNAYTKLELMTWLKFGGSLS